MSPQRIEKIWSVIRQSQPDLTVILENIFDPLNISAVLRSCDAVGVREIFVVYTRDYLHKRGLTLGKRTSGGTFKWIDVYVFEDLEECFLRVRERYGRILGTYLAAERTGMLYDIDFTEPTALLFGNEDEGVSHQAASMCDGNFIIPQVGFAESLNISVACAVTLFEARRQREAVGYYDENPRLDAAKQQALFNRWTSRLNSEKNFQEATKVTKDSEPLPPVYVRRSDEGPRKASIRPNPLTKFDL